MIKYRPNDSVKTLSATFCLSSIIMLFLLPMSTAFNAQEFGNHVSDIVREGLIEHSAGSLAVMRSIYGPDDREGQARVDFIERKLSRVQPGHPRLHAEVLASVLAILRMSKVDSLLDIGFGQGLLLRAAAREPDMTRIAGIESDEKSLQIAKVLIAANGAANPINIELHRREIGSDDLSDFRRFGAVTLVEVVEHVPDKDWIDSIFELDPGLLIVTTPNREYNALYPDNQLMPNGLRHPGHVFEFSRQEFVTWAATVGNRNGYEPSLLPIGIADTTYGSPGQMAVFHRR